MLHGIDIAIVVVYLSGVVSLGLYASRRAAAGVDSYFLSDRQAPAWLLAVSGGFSWFDITGTMWIVGLFYVYGLKAMWPQWLWGLPLAAFWMAYMGKWIRRSGVMTGAEWMKTRFGQGPAGESARAAYTLVAVVTVVAWLSYASVGIGKFWSEFLPWPPQVCAAVVLGSTAVYVVLGGMYSVIYTDVIQGLMIAVASVIVGVLAFQSLGAQPIESIAPASWASVAPVWEIPDAPDPTYKLFGLMAILWVSRGVLLGAGGPQQLYDFQRFLAARHPRDAAKIGMLWGVFFAICWAMMIGMAVLAMSRPDIHVTDPERVLPAVLAHGLPRGLRGLVLAGLMGSYMSTFDSTVNSGAAYLVRDVYQKYVAPKAGGRHLVIAGYAASAGLVTAGLVIGSAISSIDQVLQWICMALGGGVLVPCFLRWYWWRFNGWGCSVGMFTGVAASLVQVTIWPQAPEHLSFPAIVALSLVGSLAATWSTRPTDRQTLDRFYRTVRPFGFWGPVKRRLSLPPGRKKTDSAAADVAAMLIGIPWIIALYMLPIYLVIRCWTSAIESLAVFLLMSVALYFVWYRNLPPADELAGWGAKSPDATSSKGAP